MHAKFVPAVIAAVLSASATSAQEAPNVTPGMWETTSTVTIQSEQFPIPPRTETTTECVTAEKIQEGQAFLENDENCEYTQKDLRPDGMDFVMTCEIRTGGPKTDEIIKRCREQVGDLGSAVVKACVERDIEAEDALQEYESKASLNRSTMNGSLEFRGDDMTGTIAGHIDSPMGVMQINVELDGKRTGDC